MNTYWKSIAKSLGYAAAAGLYGFITTVFLQRALKHREIAVNSCTIGASDGKESTSTKG